MILTHKIALDPNDVQETYFRKAAGVARFAYNWALGQWQQQYDAWKGDPTWPKPSEVALRRQLNAIKGDAFPGMLEVTKNAPQMAVIHLGQASQRRMARLHARIANIRADALHQLTTDLVTRFDVIAIEDLNVAGMLKNHKLARTIADMGLGAFRRQLEYKAAQRGKTIIVVSRWYPSSKTCSVCGYHVSTMPLSVRKWTCPQCQAHHDRDLNAAMNLRHVAESSVGSSQPVSA